MFRPIMLIVVVHGFTVVSHAAESPGVEKLKGKPCAIDLSDLERVISCSDLDDTVVYKKGQQEITVPHYAECKVTCRATTFTWQICYNGQWKKPMKDCDHTQLKRQKRRWWWSRRRRRSPPNQHPTISCPHVPDQKADVGRSSTIVRWSSPTVWDDNDHVYPIHDRGERPGTRLNVGDYSVTYMVRDTKGLSAHCGFSFSVKAKRCPAPKYPMYGQRSCTNGQYVEGTVCTFSCYDGYKLNGSQSTSCMSNRQFTAPAPTCEERDCGNPALIQVSHGSFEIDQCTNKTSLKSVCFLRCNPGYSVVPPSYLQCSSAGTWSSNVKPCKEKNPPRFAFCPSSKDVHADEGKPSTMVTWKQPTANFNHTVRQSKGRNAGSVFQKGRHTIIYEMVDIPTITCTFVIEVYRITCDPFAAAHRMLVDCPDKYYYGSECKITCDQGYPLDGASTVKCDLDNSFPPKGIWKYGTKGKPKCKVVACTDLHIPVNGALACSNWAMGSTCMISCKLNYDVPRNADMRVPYVCSTTTGMWIPPTPVPDCGHLRRGQKMSLPASLYYYTGDCNTTALKQIKDNFVTRIATSAYASVCVNKGVCEVGNIKVTCGPATSRKRRSNKKDPHKRALDNAYKVTFDVEVPFSVGTNTVDNAVKDTSDLLQQVADHLQKEVDDDHFVMNIPGVETKLQYSSFSYDYVNVVCEKGLKPRFQTASCAPCPTGTYYNASIDDCTVCPVGYYQDEDNARGCKACPAGKSTPKHGATSLNSCIDFCPLGTLSTTGLVPCDRCPRGFYQPLVHKTNCLSCPSGLTTVGTGSEMLADCTAFDLLFERGDSIISFQNTTAGLRSLSIVAWLLVNSRSTVVSIHHESGGEQLAMKVGPTIQVYCHGEMFETNVSVSSTSWVHIAALWQPDNNALTIYKNGVEQNVSSPIPANCRTLISDGSTVELGSHNLQADMKISAFGLFYHLLDAIDIAKLARSCSETVTGAVYTIADSSITISSIATTIDRTMPSECDDKDSCIPDPCNNNACTDKQVGYHCSCFGGFSGDHCEIPPDPCFEFFCENGGFCNNTGSGLACMCKDGFKGQHCEIEIRNGGFGNWTEWTQCSTTCGPGVIVRERLCDSPPPDPDGHDCIGNTQDSKSCPLSYCASCTSLDAPYMGTINCTTGDGMQKCTVECIEGYAFAIPIEPIFTCGPGTGYKWPTQVTKVATRIPPCAVSTRPLSLASIATVTYSTLTCSMIAIEAEQIKAHILTKVHDVRCCPATVNIDNCQTASSDKLQVTVSYSHGLAGAKYLGYEAYIQNATVSPELAMLHDTQMALQSASDFLQRYTGHVFDVHVGTSVYHVDPDLIVPSHKVDCPSGSVPYEIRCMECPPGLIQYSNKCDFCPVGFYQDEHGKTFCKNCPKGTTTTVAGAASVNECVNTEQ